MSDGAPGREVVDSPTNDHATPTISIVLEELTKLREAFDSKIRYDEVREQFVQSMSDELEGHRQDFHRRLLRPVLLDLVSLYDDLTQAIDSADAEESAKSMAFFRDSVEQILVRNSVQRYTVEGGTVDRSKQRVVSMDDTPDPALQRQVSRRLRVGFAWGEKVLRPEWVSTYRHVNAESDSAEEGVTG